MPPDGTANTKDKDVSKSRFTLYPEYMRRWSPATATPATLKACEQYAQIAHNAGMKPSELAVAFCRSRPFVKENGATILGATTLEQLKENLQPFDYGFLLEV